MRTGGKSPLAVEGSNQIAPLFTRRTKDTEPILRVTTADNVPLRDDGAAVPSVLVRESVRGPGGTDPDERGTAPAGQETDCCCSLGASCVRPNINGRCLRETVGSPASSVRRYLVVGQNPGASEDTQGQVFVGKSGKALTGMLTDAGYDLSEVYLTNAVRCHTPDNRPPTPGEIKSCRPRLKEEIHRVQPQVIIALGGTALTSLTGRGGLTGRRGGSVDLHPSFGYSCEVYPTFHPAFVGRTPVVRPTVVADLVRARRTFEPPADVEWQFAGDAGLQAGLRGEGPVAYDIETDYWFTGGDNVIQAAVAATDMATVVLRGASVGRLADELRGLSVVGHNSWGFDDRLTGVESAYDTMALAYLDDETQPLGLEPLAVKYLGVAGWKDGGGADGPDSDSFALYNARDAAHTLDLFHALRDRLGPRMRLHDMVLRPAAEALRACTERGLYIHSAAVVHASAIFSERVATQLRDVRVAAGCDLNPNSPLQTAQVLLAEGHVLPLTDTGVPSTNESVLASLEQTDLVRVLRDYRKAAKSVNAFIKPYSAVAGGGLADGDSRVHPSYTLFRTATGRTSARNPNVQQLPRDPLLRAFFSAPPGYELLTADYSAVEFRIAAFVAGEESVLLRYRDNPDWDPHRYFASVLYDKLQSEVTKEERQVAKSANFGLLYMAQAPALQEYARKMGVSLTLAEAAGIRRRFHEVYPAFRPWYADVAQHLFKDGYVETFTGRRRHFGDPHLLVGSRRSEALREAVNTHVQGPAADIALLGLVGCHGAGYPINGFFHDAISFENKAGTSASAIEGITSCMTEYPVRVLRENFDVNFTVPLTIDWKVSHA